MVILSASAIPSMCESRVASEVRRETIWPLGSLIGRPHLAQPDMTMCDHRLGTSYLDFNSL